MAQHDMNIANQGFPATRADLNNALQAIATNNSGTSAPSTTFANQWFYNETSNKLFIRNEANNAFIEVATLDQTNNEWQITTGVIQAKDSDGLALKTDDGNSRIFIADGGDVTFLTGTDILTASAGTDNVRIGEGAGANFASGGDNNTAVGKNAANAITTGDDNTAVGKGALDAATTGSDCVAIGSNALGAQTDGTLNTAVGAAAGLSITSAASNTMVGHGAGQNTNSDKNTFVGRTAGFNVTSGAKNTILGRFNGNENGLDIRTTSNNIVLSDGDGNPRLRFDPATLQFMLEDGVAIGVRKNINLVSVGSGAVVIDFDTLGNSQAKRGFYMVTVVREGGSVGTHGVFLIATASSSLAILYQTLVKSSNMSISISGSQMTITAAGTNVYANVFPIGIQGGTT
tara:strand:- start:231 stop:1436 length:1206 start_codon:yes stop_codon:yes gene_type:complete